MFKCTGRCSQCGRCKNSAMISGANDRKTRMVEYPNDFKADADKGGYGIAFDIGTTTVVGMLWDLASGEMLATHAESNPQSEFGLDVISRITYCGKKGENLGVLRDKIVACLNLIIGKTCDVAGINSESINSVTVCGNTTMSHIFAGYPPMSLALAPFDPAYTGTLRLTAEGSKLNINASGELTVLPNIAGHVGGDITAGLVASRALDTGTLTVFIDIGTNGEIVLTDGDKALACSTAAGPAFEGSAIKHGMRAAMGAIEKIRIEDGDVDFKVIGECEPQGICGSGLIDAIAQMLSSELISKSGRLICAEDVDRKKLNTLFKERLVDIEGERCFVLVSKTDGEDIVITQKDIREVQLAKGAIAAGIKLISENAGCSPEDIEQVIVAGAFGSCVDKGSAVRIGILPDIEMDRIKSIGNAAGAGVSMALMSEKEMELAEKVSVRVEHVELACMENFQSIYLDMMAFK